MLNELLSVYSSSPQMDAQAQSLANILHVDWVDHFNEPSQTNTAFVLEVDQQGLNLQQSGPKAPGPIRAEFTEGSVDHRRKFGGGKGQMIAKAVGVSAHFFPHVLDATAGLGKDAFVLATLGCKLHLLERSPLVYLLLKDGLERARQHALFNDPDLSQILSRMVLEEKNSLEFLKSSSDEKFDVVFLDPMFPERQKSAEVKKEMVAFHQLVGKDEDADQLLPLALEKAIYRVVVKRPRKAPFLNQQKPTYQLEGKSSRFDIYALKKIP